MIPAVIVELVGVRRDVRGDLGLQRRSGHPPGTERRVVPAQGGGARPGFAT
jgi:hypothetical protein